MNKHTPRDLAVAAADLAADGKAFGITILDVREVSSVADFFVIASGRSHIQVESICDRIVAGLSERFEARPISVEGLENAQWALLDFGSVVVHVFQESIREMYDLERLWSLAPRWRHAEAGAGAASVHAEGHAMQSSPAKTVADEPRRTARV